MPEKYSGLLIIKTYIIGKESLYLNMKLKELEGGEFLDIGLKKLAWTHDG